MTTKKAWLVILIVSLFVSLILPNYAEAKTRTLTIDNKSLKSVKTVKITKRWYRPRAKKGGYQRQAVTGKSKKYEGISEKGQHYSFNRFAFLADGKPGKKFKKYNKIRLLGKYAEPQGVAIVKPKASGHTYMFIQMSFNKGNNKRSGRIVRYDLSVLEKYVDKNGKHDKIVRVLKKSKKYITSLSKTKKGIKNWRAKRRDAKKHLSKKSYKIFSTVAVGAKFKMGHGQSFAYNPKDHCLYNAALTLKADRGELHPFKFQKINMKDLKPSKTWNLNVRVRRTAKRAGVRYHRLKTYLQMHDLTFDKGGHFYFTEVTHRMKSMKNRYSAYAKHGFKPTHNHYGKYIKSLGGTVTIYRGTMKKSPGKIHMMTKISNSIGTMGQGLAYSNRKGMNRIFLVYDNAFMSMPVKNLRKLKAKQIHFSVLKAKYYRESEGMGITSAGRGYLIMNRFAEATRSSKAIH